MRTYLQKDCKQTFRESDGLERPIRLKKLEPHDFFFSVSFRSNNLFSCATGMRVRQGSEMRALT